MQHKITGLVGVLLWMLVACRSTGILQGSSHEATFRERYLHKSFYTAMALHPYRYNDEYLVDLTGTVAEVDSETLRAPVIVPLGTPITIVGLTEKHVLARIPGQTQLFRILVHTQQGTVEDVAKELTLVLSKEPPLQFARPEMQAFVERQEITRGMTRRELSMSWGLPDKTNGVPGGGGTLEEWIYFDKRVHVFLDNGVVTNWQQF